MRRAVLGVAGFLLLVAVWHIAHSRRWLNPTLLPSPAASFSRLWWLFSTGNIMPDFRSTLLRTGLGYGMAAVVGVVLGIAVGSIQWLYELLTPLLDAVRSLPVTSLYPLFVLFFGIRSAPKVAMIFTAAVFV